MADFWQQLINGILLGGMYALMALGLTLMFGVMKIANFAYGTLYMVGGYVAYVASMWFGLGFFPALAVTFIVMFGFGAALEVSAFSPVRESEERTIVLGLGLLLLGRGLVIRAFGSQTFYLNLPVNGRINWGSLVLSQERLFTFGMAVVLVVAVWLLISRTRVGSIVRAVSDNAERALTLGISRKRVYLTVFGLSTGLAAVAASLLSVSFGIVPTTDNRALITSFTIIILGGMGSTTGALVGGLLIGLVQTLGTQYLSQTYTPAYPYVLLLLILLIRPQGLFGRKERVT